MRRAFVIVVVALVMAPAAANAQAPPTPAPAPDLPVDPFNPLPPGVLPEDPLRLPTPEQPSVTPCDPTAGVSALLAGPARDPGTPPASNLSRFGVCGYQIHHQLEPGASPASIAKWMLAAGNSALAERMFRGAVALTAANVAMQRWASEVSVIDYLGPVTAKVIRTLADLYWQLLAVTLPVAGILVYRRFRNGRTEEAAMMLVLIIASITLAVRLVQDPLGVMRFPAAVATELRTTLLSAATPADGAQLADIYEQQVVRVGVDMPYAILQFGTTGADEQEQEGLEQLAVELHAADAYAVDELAAIAADPGAAEAIDASHDERYRLALATLEDEYPTTLTWVRGEQTGEQLIIAGLALGAAAISNLVQIALALADTAADVLVQAAWVAVVLVLAFAVLGRPGRIAFFLVLGGLMALSFASVVVTLVQVVSLAFNAATLAQVSTIGGGWLAAMMITLVTALVFVRVIPMVSRGLRVITMGGHAGADPYSYAVERTVAAERGLGRGVVALPGRVRRRRQERSQQEALPAGDESAEYDRVMQQQDRAVIFRLAEDASAIRQRMDTSFTSERPRRQRPPPMPGRDDALAVEHPVTVSTPPAEGTTGWQGERRSTPAFMGRPIEGREAPLEERYETYVPPKPPKPVQREELRDPVQRARAERATREQRGRWVDEWDEREGEDR